MKRKCQPIPLDRGGFWLISFSSIYNYWAGSPANLHLKGGPEMIKKEKELVATFDELLEQIRELTDEIGDAEVVDVLTDHIKADAANKEPASSITAAYELALPVHELKRLCLGSVLTRANDDTIFLLLDFIQSALKAITDLEAGRVPSAHSMEKVRQFGHDHLDDLIIELMNRTSDYREEIQS